MMSQPDMTPDDLLKWNDATAANWRDLVNTNPAILQLPSDIRDAKTVGQVLQHIAAVELRFAQRLAAQPESDYNDVRYGTGDEVYATHAQALDILRMLLADKTYDWAVEFDFNTITLGRIRASRQAVFLHALMHSIRHYAQLATLVRQHGFKPGWPMDYLYLTAKRV